MEADCTPEKMNDPRLRLSFFTTDPDRAEIAENAGVDCIIVDWEKKGKGERQHGYNTEINTDTVGDVARLESKIEIPIVVRVNPMGTETAREIQRAIDYGASGLMLPMAREVEEVRQFVDMVGNAALTIVQIETQSLVENCEGLREIPWDAAYIGLNDLMISRDGSWIWEALFDGTVDFIFDCLSDRVVGFAGATVIGGGAPIPFTELLREMGRLGCQMTFLRRTFRREIQGRDMVSEINAIRTAWRATCRRSDEAVQRDHTWFREEFSRCS